MKPKKKSTVQVIHEYGELLTTIYLVVMLAVLPLFYHNGYSDIANAKYKMYRLITIVFVVICGLICFSAETGMFKCENLRKRPLVPVSCVIIHFFSNLISWIFSSDHKLSWIGNGSWHMGFLSQLLFLLSMLLVFYYFKNRIIIWAAAGLGAGITGLLTVLNRFDIYPLDMGNKYPGFISTLGQTNWATMYVACLMGVGIGLFINEEKLIKRIIILLVDALIFMGAWVVGSDTILPVIVAELFILLGICLKKREYMKRFVVILSVLGVVTEIIYFLVFELFHDRFVFVDENDAVNSLLKKQIGVWFIVVAALIFMLISLMKNKEWDSNILTNLYKLMVAGVLLSVIFIIIAMVTVTNTPEKAGALANVRMLRFDYDWGTHRGLNWRCAVYGFARMSPLRKIVGTGQGGFEAYIYSFQDFSDSLHEMYGKYKLMVAHNEYLNFLIENGIIGCLSYMGFMISSFSLLWKRAGESRLSLMALLSLSGYIACSIFFFQHVYAPSFMYIFIAMALSEVRNAGTAL